MYKTIISLVLTAAVFFGCSADQNSDKTADQPASQMEETTQSKKSNTEITETYWKLVSLQGEEVSIPKDQREPHIILKTEDDNVTGSGGCNVLNGTYKLGENSSISFSKMATTMMSCPDMKTEEQFLKVFEKIEFYRLKDDTLLLNGSNENTLAKFVSVADSVEKD